ncbi:MAG: N-acetyl-gamma-glutamyl-phosphate reductase [Rickettsiales bacterium]|nr:N-acetyl-gamma-glutamyl-phosphate reductase [Rickettsiales bacterium]
MTKINAAVIGATGYTGYELVKILAHHPNVDIKYLSSRSNVGVKYTDIYPQLKHILSEITCIEDNINKIANEVDVIFLALPHGVSSSKINKDILNKTKIIDLSADFRLHDLSTYEQWYCKHNSPDLLQDAVYGLAEIYRNDIKKANLIANPGCYTTCSILTLYPLVKYGLIDTNTIIIDAKSGVSGSGRSVSFNSMFCEANESVKAYKIASHRHTPEIEQELSAAGQIDIKVQFTPHLVPMNRGLLTTCYAKLKTGITEKDVKNAYQEQYAGEFFVRLLDDGVFPETKYVQNTNFIDMNFKIDERTGNIICVGAIDNLIKGAGGQAVQIMNMIFGFDETNGLI